MTEIDVEQNSEQWKNLRKLGSSEVGTAIGVLWYNGGELLPPIAYPADFIQNKIDIKTDPSKKVDFTCEMTEFGHLAEPLIADYVAELLKPSKIDVALAGLVLDEERPNDFSCSPDRKLLINGEWKGVLEIKAPWFTLYGYMKEIYRCQLMYQLMICKKDWAIWFASRCDHEKPDPSKSEYLCFFTMRDDDYIKVMRQRASEVIGFIERNEVPSRDKWVKGESMMIEFPLIEIRFPTVINIEELSKRWYAEKKKMQDYLSKLDFINLDVTPDRLWLVRKSKRWILCGDTFVHRETLQKFKGVTWKHAEGHYDLGADWELSPEIQNFIRKHSGSKYKRHRWDEYKKTIEKK